MMETSCAMVSRTPGRCTFTATSSPVSRVARCTWAREAEPNGLGVDVREDLLGGSARIRRRARRSPPWNRAWGRRRRAVWTSSSQKLCGSISERIDRIWPDFDEGGSERLEHEAHLDGCQAVAARRTASAIMDDLAQSLDLAAAASDGSASAKSFLSSEQCQRFVGYARSRLGNGLLERVRRVDGPVRRRLTFGFRRRQNRVDAAG